MAWEEIAGPGPSLSVNTNGVLEWNSALQIELHDPNWVHVHFDAVTQQLGVMGATSRHGLPVFREPDKNTFSVNSSDALSDAGISIPSPVSAAPPGLWAGLLGNTQHTIYYLQL